VFADDRTLLVTTGQWMEEDPKYTEAGDGNVRRYVGNNSTNRIDPSGLIGIFIDGTGQAEDSKTILRELDATYKGGEHRRFLVRLAAPSGISTPEIPAYVPRVEWGQRSLFPSGLTFEKRTIHPIVFLDDPVADAVKFAKEAYARKQDKVDIFGWSRGAIYAMEVARQLQDAGIPVRFLALIDPVAVGTVNYRNTTIRNNMIDLVFVALKNGNLPKGYEPGKLYRVTHWLADHTIFRGSGIQPTHPDLGNIIVQPFDTNHALSGFLEPNRVIYNALLEAAHWARVPF
jgi:pimeloyl-ACP methyl ester carboxylesterase